MRSTSGRGIEDSDCHREVCLNSVVMVREYERRARLECRSHLVEDGGEPFSEVFETALHGGVASELLLVSGRRLIEAAVTVCCASRRSHT